jgi:hypothetical protein
VSDTDLCPVCGGDCGMSNCPTCGGCENTGGDLLCPDCQPDSESYPADDDDDEEWDG